MWIEIALAVLGLGAGIGAGTLYFRNLWKSARTAVGSDQPVAKLVTSFLLRASLFGLVLAVAFYASLYAGLAMALGFLVARRIALKPFREEPACN